MKVKKAVIPAAGLGTRVLPASKAVPKEMLPIVDKPAIQYIVEEAVSSGIEDILIITNRGKGVIEDHFDHSPELEKKLLENQKKEIYEQVSKLSKLANIYFIRQKETKGLGHAISCAKSFVGSEPFTVLYGDDVIISKEPACLQLMKAYEEYKVPILGVNKVKKEDIYKYSSLKVEPIKDNLFKCTDMVEKPSQSEIMSLYSILGRCVLTSDIFDALEKTKPGAGGEIQLTDAIKTLARTSGTVAVEFTGKRYDMGSKLGMMQAAVEVAITHEEIGENFKEYLKDIVKSF